MSLLGAPLEADEIEELRQLFPEFEGEVPEEAKFWSKGDLELFFGSGGQLRPRESARPAGAPTCALLTRIRHKLADDNVDEPTAEYQSFCRHLREREEAHFLPDFADCSMLQRSECAPTMLKCPVLLNRPRDWPARAWNAEFWKREYGGDWWKFRSRSPMFSGDSSASTADRVAVEGTAAEYVDYVRILQRMDPLCKADNAVAFPRVAMDSWAAFCGGARPLFDSCWKELMPAGVKDLTPRWVKAFAAVFNMDWLEFLARFFRVTMGAAGTISRLHCENHGAHVWFSQIEGRRLFVLFSPKDVATGCLYQEAGGFCEGPEGYAALASPADVLFPSHKRHPKLAEAKAQVVVLRPGETLVIPGGWWRYSVALETSVTLHHHFWNTQNRTRIVEEFREAFEDSTMPPELKELAGQHLAQLRERITEDDDSDMED